MRILLLLSKVHIPRNQLRGNKSPMTLEYECKSTSIIWWI